jgi:isopentenyl-diphosphate delta-isomerase
MNTQDTNQFCSQFENRKDEHISLALKPENEAIEKNYFDSITLLHEALPEIDFNEIDTTVNIFDNKIKTPFIVSSITAGSKKSEKINLNIAKACQNTGWMMGIGSQRIQLVDNLAKKECLKLRKEAPNIKLFGNIGLSQLINTSISDIEHLLDPLEANGIFIHTNPLQECIQHEGTPQFKGGIKALEKLCSAIKLPVILKETGCGFSINTLKKLKNIGLYAIDVSGFGGTHFGRIEQARNKNRTNTFNNWGINTVQSVLNAIQLKPDYKVWASGGVRSGLDAAKLIAMGVQTVGFAKPILEASILGYKEIISIMKKIKHEFKVSMFCTGSKNIKTLQINKVWTKTK